MSLNLPNTTSAKRAFITILAVIAIGCQGIQGESLDAVVATVSRLHPVANVDVSELRDSIASETVRERLVMFDVRKVEEFEVSHLEGAVRVDPDISADAFLKQHGYMLKDRTAVFYCSVGYRSSILVERIAKVKGDSTRLVNLRGGLFQWYNDGLAVYDSAGVTDKVHPFSNYWGRLLVAPTVKASEGRGR
jgi:rhodanese-related sulfurtransferase